MLKFTTESRPHSLIAECGPFLANPIEPCRIGFTDKALVTVYFHGSLQNKAGFDIATHIDGVWTLKTDIVPCQAILGTRWPGPVSAKMFMWKAKNIFADPTLQNWKGLIVEDSDKESLLFALGKFTEKAWTL